MPASRASPNSLAMCLLSAADGLAAAALRFAADMSLGLGISGRALFVSAAGVQAIVVAERAMAKTASTGAALRPAYDGEIGLRFDLRSSLFAFHGRGDLRPNPPGKRRQARPKGERKIKTQMSLVPLAQDTQAGDLLKCPETARRGRAAPGGTVQDVLQATRHAQYGGGPTFQSARSMDHEFSPH